jgi:hypothetical protein
MRCAREAVANSGEVREHLLRGFYSLTSIVLVAECLVLAPRRNGKK